MGLFDVYTQPTAKFTEQLAKRSAQLKSEKEAQGLADIGISEDEKTALLEKQLDFKNDIGRAKSALARDPDNPTIKKTLDYLTQDYSNWADVNSAQLEEAEIDTDLGYDADEWLESLSDVFDSSDFSGFGEDLISQAGEQIPGLVDAFSNTLDRPFGEASDATIANLVSRGMSRSGQKQEKLADLAAQRQLTEEQFRGRATKGIADYYTTAEDEAYQRAWETAKNKMIAGFQDSGQTWEQYWSANQQNMQNTLNDELQREQIDLQKYVNQSQQNMQDYQDQGQAVGNLFGSIGGIVGGAAQKSASGGTSSSSGSGDYFSDLYSDSSPSIYNKSKRSFGDYTDLTGGR